MIDNGRIETEIRSMTDGGVDAVLELVGQPTLEDSISCLKPGGIVCQTGLLGDKWDYWVTSMPNAPEGIRRVTYSSEAVDADNTKPAMQHIVDQVARGAYRANIDRVFSMDEIVEAHRIMEQSQASGKLVILTDDA